MDKSNYYTIQIPVLSVLLSGFFSKLEMKPAN